MKRFSEGELEDLNRKFHAASPECVIRWAHEEFQPKVAVTSSFQTQSLPLLHMISMWCPEVPVFFLDTGFHFPETKTYVRQIQELFGLNVIWISCLSGHRSFLERYGRLHERNPDMCCYLNKVEPLERALTGYEAWISGIRRDQTSFRAKTSSLSLHNEARVKICPMVQVTRDEIEAYVLRNAFPRHPLETKGYRSIGCAPCTRPVGRNDDDRAGRWAGKEKSECGIHLEKFLPTKQHQD